MQKLASAAQLIEQVYEQLVNAICDGELAPGERITQEALAASMGVSRQPVLQAFQVLKRNGFITEAGKKGVMVTPINPDKLLQLYQVRATLDALAAETAAERAQRGLLTGSEAQDDRLLAAGFKAAAEGNLRTLVQLDITFHQRIYAHSGNEIIAETCSLHWQHIRRAMMTILSQDVIPFPTVWEEHREILAAIRAGDAGRAATLAKAHALDAATKVRLALAAPQA